MATAWIRLDAFDALPGICALTGEPTDIRFTVHAEYVPPALRWLQLFSVWSFVFARSSAHRRRAVRLPVSRRAFRRHRIWQLSCVGVFVVGVVVGLSGSVSVHPLVELIGYALAAVGFGVGVRTEQRTWVGLNVDRKAEEVTVTRCHPAFATAAGRVAAAQRAGGRSVQRPTAAARSVAARSAAARTAAGRAAAGGSVVGRAVAGRIAAGRRAGKGRP